VSGVPLDEEREGETGDSTGEGLISVTSSRRRDDVEDVLEGVEDLNLFV